MRVGLIEDLPGALLDLRYQDHYGLMEVYMAKLRSHNNKLSMREQCGKFSTN